MVPAGIFSSHSLHRVMWFTAAQMKSLPIAGFTGLRMWRKLITLLHVSGSQSPCNPAHKGNPPA
jgi:hypothetical protein